MYIELMLPFNHLILCHPLLLLPSSFPSIRIFLSESTVCKWPKGTIPLMNIQGWFPLGLMSLISLQFKGLLRVFSSTNLKESIHWHSTFFMVQFWTSVPDYQKNLWLYVLAKWCLCFLMYCWSCRLIIAFFMVDNTPLYIGATYLSIHLYPLQHWQGIIVVKNLPASAEDVCLIPGLGSSCEKGNGNPLQYSCLDNPMDRRAWQAIVHGVTNSQKALNTNYSFNNTVYKNNFKID